MLKLDLKEIKEKELMILDYIDNICKNNGIRYYLVWGTLLGAVRHQGFIPWDDDIDVAMSRKDFQKFIYAIKKKDLYYLRSYECDISVNEVLAKVVDKSTIAKPFGRYCQYNDSSKLGVYVDIFIIEDLPINEAKRKLFMKTCYFLQLAILLSIRNFIISKYSIVKDLCKCIISIPFRIIGPNLFKKILKILLNDNIKMKSNKVSIVIKGDIKGICYNRSLFGDPKYLKFEGKEYPVPNDYEKLLFLWYGDYMKLPKEEKRISNHEYEYYTINKE